jgi:hypothetical protein
MRFALCTPSHLPIFFSTIGHGHTQTNTDSKTIYKISVRVRLCGSVAILTAHKFQSHVSHLLTFPRLPSALCPMPYAPCPMPYALCPMRFALCSPSDLPIFPPSIFPPSLRGVGPYGPYGFRLVDRAYSSERPEAEFRLPHSVSSPI